MPARWSSRARLVSILVRVKTSTWLNSGRSEQLYQKRALASAATGWTRCVMVSETVLRRATSMSTGDWSIRSARF